MGGVGAAMTNPPILPVLGSVIEEEKRHFCWFFFLILASWKTGVCLCVCVLLFCHAAGPSALYCVAVEVPSGSSLMPKL